MKDSMEPGKIEEKIFKRSVLKYIKQNNSPEEKNRFSTATIVVEDRISILSGISKAVNNILAAGAKPEHAVLNLSLPSKTCESELKELVKYINELCEDSEITVSCVEAEVLPCISKPVVTYTCAGSLKNDSFDLRKASPGQQIVMTKAIGIEGTAIITARKEECLKERFSSSFLRQCLKFKNHLFIKKEVMLADTLCDLNGNKLVNAAYNVSDRGIYAALWDLAEEAGCGLMAYLKDIPVWQETIELTELYDIDPYRMASSGSVLFLTDNGELLAQKLCENGVPAAVIGSLEPGNDRVVISSDNEKRYLEPPRGDEIYKIFL